MTKALNCVDLCFVVDTTGSMGSFIEAAKQQLLDTISLLKADSGIDLEVGLVEYRDHPPQDNSFVTRVYPLTANLKEMQKAINQLKADGGGDGPEAVYSGVRDACVQMQWRPYSCRFILLVGDAPPHGFAKWLQEMLPTQQRGGRGGNGDGWPNGCPSGLNVQSIAAAAENQRVTVHALCMGGDAFTMQAFGAIATATGGQSAAASSAKDVISKMVAMLKDEFRDLEFDRQVLETVLNLGNLDSTQVADTLACPRLQAAAAIARLGKRGFLDF
ncbi:vWA domain-containing protein [Argonema antarcticum]|uniref:vWA domain-containing protein n=1 Tax=Argonema antarcticum TaxID=2942763 RepID=UPI00201206AD|nr:VWA domain-containing protein [Argonema antarcticum]MCL1475649.1 VWA domain-containing protein [Argonema antarcticum A004/B2]